MHWKQVCFLGSTIKQALLPSLTKIVDLNGTKGDFQVQKIYLHLVLFSNKKYLINFSIFAVMKHVTSALFEQKLEKSILLLCTF